jgi:hypothetical protein
MAKAEGVALDRPDITLSEFRLKYRQIVVTIARRLSHWLSSIDVLGAPKSHAGHPWSLGFTKAVHDLEPT